MQNDLPPPDSAKEAQDDTYSRSWDAQIFEGFDSDSEDTSSHGKYRPPNSYPKQKKKLSAFRRKKFEDFIHDDGDDGISVSIPKPIEMEPVVRRDPAFKMIGQMVFMDSGMTQNSSFPPGHAEAPTSPVSDSKTSEDSFSPRLLGFSGNLSSVDDEEVVPGAGFNVDPCMDNRAHHERSQLDDVNDVDADEIPLPAAPHIPPAASRLMLFFISQEAAYCENIRKIHELSGLYVMRQQNLICEETSIIFPPVIATFLKKMCDFSTSLPQIWTEENEDPILAVLECCCENLRDLADEHVLYATSYYASRDTAFQLLRDDIEFFSLCEHKSREWEKYDDAKSPTLLDLLYQPIIRPTEQIAFFETLSRKLDSDDPRKHELIMTAMQILRQTEEDICTALKVNSLDLVDSRNKEALEDIYKKRSRSLTRFSLTSSHSIRLLPDSVPEPRLRKNTDWDVLGGSYSVKKGHFYKLSRKGKPKLYCFWLFNDVLLYGYDKNYVWKTRKGLSVDKNFCVNQVQHREYTNAFELHSSTKSFVAFTSTAEQKASWMEAFNSVQWKAMYDPPENVRRAPIRLRMSSRCDTCEMPSCSNSLNGLLGFLQKYYCGFCGKCICSDCGRYSLPYPCERKDQRACVRCYFKVMKYPRLQKQSHLCPPGHYIAIKDRIPVRRLDSVASEKLPEIRQGDIVHVTECRYASARILSPRNGYVPLFIEGHKVLCDWDIKSWTNDLVCQFVENIDLPQYVHKFRELKIQGEDLFMGEHDLDLSLLEDFGMQQHILRLRFIRKFALLKEKYEMLRHHYDSDLENYDNISECGESRSSIVEENNEIAKAPQRNDHGGGEGIPQVQTMIADMYLGNVPPDI